jgi:Arc/MetJ family transcription regulator
VTSGVYTAAGSYILQKLSKHLVDIDDGALRDARAELRTSTIKDTVNEALRRAGAGRRRRVKRALDALAEAALIAREQAWR